MAFVVFAGAWHGMLFTIKDGKIKGWKIIIHFHLHQYKRMEHNKLKIHFTFMKVNYLHETKQNIVELNRNTIIERIFGHSQGLGNTERQLARFSSG